MAPPPRSSGGSIVDLPALILSNCSVFSHPRAVINFATEIDPRGAWKVNILKSENGKRQVLFSESSTESLEAAFEGLLVLSSKAVHNFADSHPDFDFPKEVKITSGGSKSNVNGPADDEKSNDDDEATDDGMSIISLADSTARPCRENSAKLWARRSGASLSSGHQDTGPRLQPPRHSLSGTPPPPPTPTPAPALALPCSETAVARPLDLPGTKSDIVACMTICWPNHYDIKVLTRVRPTQTALRAKAVDIVVRRACEGDEDEAEIPELHVSIRSVRLGNDEFELHGMGDDLSDLISPSEVPRFFIDVSSA